MTLQLTNNATALLAGSISDSDTEIALSTGKGALFPSLAGVGDWSPIVVVTGSTREIMRATARAGDVLTVERAQEGTSAMAFEAGARVDLRLTAAGVAAVVSDLEAAIAAAITVSEGKLNAASGTSLLFPQAAAPTGWTQDVAVNDRLMRVVSGPGGGTGGDWEISGITIAGHALTVAEMAEHLHAAGTLLTNSHRHGAGTLEAAAHRHNYTRYNAKTSAQAGGGSGRWVNDSNEETSSTGPLAVSGETADSGTIEVTGNTANAGSGDAHNHDASHDGNWRPAYMDCIRAVKD